VAEPGGGDELLVDVTTTEPVVGRPTPATHEPQAQPTDWWSRFSSTWTERAQDVVSSLVAVCLIVLAAAILVAAIVDFFSTAHRGFTAAATVFLDKGLLVLILVEVVHTVVLSLRAHALAAQPFLVVGLVAVIRKILFALGGQQRLGTETLALYLAMVAVFVAALIAIEVFGRRRSRAAARDPEPH
jgi:uncharacterized membrane protein (DUF373 family)